ncbi:EmrB/QacA subfamily drug resistance transporter [Stackebrandtia albiflava]|uniref:EmrB/QacA subfamily drug resistance transporter n=1 Tax=Stackebrandtia albiflava TaxID=406432 RepID=A0A562V571_9ACTN|nr:MDR family MFS transporter [Stackebrandtia albiflava]TWJ13023.1 EmrB/QacA subfamily drug resistance transporter [Stackebrandtia albiflava]
MSQAERPTAAPPKMRREVLIVLPGLMLAILLAMLDNTIIGTAMPTIVGEFGGYAHMSWVVTAYILAATVSTPLYGKLGDIYGRKRLFMFAIGLFLIGSAASGAAQSMAQLIAFRGVQGLGAGGLMVGAMAILGDLVSPRERGRYQGFMAAVMMLSTIGGPLVGGFLTDQFTWRWAFYINLPLGAIALIVIALTLKLPRHRARVRIDYAGIALLSLAAAGLVLFTTWGGTEYAWDSPQIIGLGMVSVLALVGLVVVERRAAEPVLPLRLFTDRNFVVINVIGFLQGFAMMGAMTFIPMYQQIVQGQTPTESGLWFIPMMLAAMTCSLAAGSYVTRTGRYKIFPIVGGAILIVGMVLLTGLSVDTSLIQTAIYLVVFGAGLGLLMQITMLVAQNSAPQRDIGVASSTATFLRNIGGSFGVALFGAVFADRLAASVQGRLPAEIAANFNGGGEGAGLDPEKVALLPEWMRAIVTGGVTDGLTTVFVWTIPFAAVAFLLAWFVKEVPLRGSPSAESTPAAVEDAHVKAPV